MAGEDHTILVIEDNKDVLEVIQQALEYFGYEHEGVLHYDDQLFEKIKQGKYSLLILDMMLSGHDGRDLVKQFRLTRETKELPVIIISAYPNVEESVKEAGANDFLNKPFGVDELKQKIDQYM